MSEEKEREHDLGTELWYDLTVDLNSAHCLRPVGAIVAQVGPQEPPFWTTLGPLGDLSAQYSAHVGNSFALHR